MRLKDHFLNFIKGAIIGLSSLISFVSSGTLMIAFCLHEITVKAIGNFFKDIKTNIRVLFPIVFGFLSGIISSHKLIVLVIDKAKAQTYLLFIGLAAGGIALILKKVNCKSIKSNYIYLLIGIIIPILLYLFFPDIKSFDSIINIKNIMLLLGIGLICGFFLLVPSFDYILVRNNLNLNDIVNIIFLSVGLLLGLYIFCKIILRLYKKYSDIVLYILIGLICSNIIIMILQINKFKFDFLTITTSVIALLWGYLLAIKLEQE